MQFGIFTVGDVTTDPTTGATPSEAERIRATVTIAKKAEEVELDIFATGEHHNPPFVPSSPTTLLGYIAAQTERLLLSIKPNKPPHRTDGQAHGYSAALEYGVRVLKVKRIVVLGLAAMSFNLLLGFTG